MKLNLERWAEGRDKLIARLDAGAWRHGIKTRDAIKEVIRYGGFPADPSSMLVAKWRPKNGQIYDFALYYLAQSALKNRYRSIKGDSGRVIRVRRFHCVEHGAAEDERDDDGQLVRPSKEGLWLRIDDMTSIDVASARAGYRGRETDSGGEKFFLLIAERVLSAKPAETRLGDVLDEIKRAI